MKMTTTQSNKVIADRLSSYGTVCPAYVSLTFSAGSLKSIRWTAWLMRWDFAKAQYVYADIGLGPTPAQALAFLARSIIISYEVNARNAAIA
jgi:hypothetical protein